MNTQNASAFQYLHLSMDFAESVYNTANLCPPKEDTQPFFLDELVCRVIVVTVIPFFLLSIAEGLILNGFKVVYNFNILFINTVVSFFEENESDIEVIDEPEPAIEALNTSEYINTINSPEITPEQITGIEFIVETMAAGMLKVMNKKQELEDLGTSFKEILHPFATLAIIFGKNSKIQPETVENFKTSWVVSNFKSGLIDAFQHNNFKGLHLKFLKWFSDEVQIPYGTLLVLVNEKNWRELVTLFFSK